MFKTKSLLKKKRLQEQQEVIAAELFHACSTEPVSFSSIQSLLQQYPSSIQSKNKNGNIPLHLACFHGASLQVVEYLVSSWPSSLSVEDDQGSLALHWACFGQKCDLLVIQNLLLQNPSSISHQTHNKQIPLHYACANGGSLQIVQVLCQKYQQGTRQENSNGLLPLHVACSSKVASLEVVMYLVTQDPSTLYSKTTTTSELPVDRAIACGAPTVVIDYLQDELNKSGSSRNVNVAGKCTALVVVA